MVLLKGKYSFQAFVLLFVGTEGLFGIELENYAENDTEAEE